MAENTRGQRPGAMISDALHRAAPMAITMAAGVVSLCARVLHDRNEELRGQLQEVDEGAHATALRARREGYQLGREHERAGTPDAYAGDFLVDSAELVPDGPGDGDGVPEGGHAEHPDQHTYPGG